METRKRLNPVNILVLTFWSFKEGLIQTYTLPYLHIIAEQIPEGSKIYLLTLEKPNHLISSSEEKQKIKKNLEQQKINWITFSYDGLSVLSMLKWAWILIRLYFLIFIKDIKFIHSFCTPPGVAGYLLSLFSGKKLILDSYEPHAEACIESGDWKKDSFAFKFLFFFERLMSNKAHTIISATLGMRQYAKQKYNASFTRFYVKPACVDLNQFSELNLKKPNLVKSFGYENKIVCVYAGKFGGIYLKKEAFDYLKIAHDYWGDKFRILFLTGHTREEIDRWAIESNLEPSIITCKFVMHHEIADYVGLGDFAYTPVKPIPTKKFCTPIKNGEYWALGLPIVSTANISDDSEIIEKNEIGSIIQEFNEKSYLKSVKEIDAILKNNSRSELYKTIRGIAVNYRSFSIADKIYKEIYQSKAV